MDRTESVLDYSQLEIKKGINTTDVKPVVRVNKFNFYIDYSLQQLHSKLLLLFSYLFNQNINVGQCVGNTGSCLGNKTETCLLRDKKNPTICVAGLYTKQHSCTPARFKIHEYRSIIISISHKINF